MSNISGVPRQGTTKDHSWYGTRPWYTRRAPMIKAIDAVLYVITPPIIYVPVRMLIDWLWRL